MPHTSRCCLVITGLVYACGPSVVEGGPTTGSDDTTQSQGTEGSTSDGSATSPLSTSTSPIDDTGLPDGSTGPADESSSGTTGSSDGAVQCFDTEDPRDDQCCPELPQPCPMIFHGCPQLEGCSLDPFASPVSDPMAAQCMLAALATGGHAVYDRQIWSGFLVFRQQWLVDASGSVTLVRWEVGGFSFGYDFSTCQLVEASVLEQCAMEGDPQVLSDCLAGALVECEAVEEAVCPG